MSISFGLEFDKAPKTIVKDSCCGDIYCPYCNGTGISTHEEQEHCLSLSNANANDILALLGLANDDRWERPTEVGSNLIHLGQTPDAIKRKLTVLLDIVNACRKHNSDLVWG